MTDKYCNKCGKELNFIETDKFNVETGEREKHWHCPTRTCGHYGIQHEYVYSYHFWRGDTFTCKKCGKIS